MRTGPSGRSRLSSSSDVNSLRWNGLPEWPSSNSEAFGEEIIKSPEGRRTRPNSATTRSGSLTCSMVSKDVTTSKAAGGSGNFVRSACHKAHVCDSIANSRLSHCVSIDVHANHQPSRGPRKEGCAVPAAASCIKNNLVGNEGASMVIACSVLTPQRVRRVRIQPLEPLHRASSSTLYTMQACCAPSRMALSDRACADSFRAILSTRSRTVGRPVERGWPQGRCSAPIPLAVLSLRQASSIGATLDPGLEQGAEERPLDAPAHLACSVRPEDSTPTNGSTDPTARVRTGARGQERCTAVLTAPRFSLSCRRPTRGGQVQRCSDEASVRRSIVGVLGEKGPANALNH